MEEAKTIRELLEDEYRKILKEVSEAEECSEEAKLKMQRLNELGKQLQLISQTDSEFASKMFEIEHKAEQIRETRIDHRVNWCINGFSIVSQLLFAGYWLGKGMKFEETGSFTSRVWQWVQAPMRFFKK